MLNFRGSRERPPVPSREHIIEGSAVEITGPVVTTAPTVDASRWLGRGSGALVATGARREELMNSRVPGRKHFGLKDILPRSLRGKGALAVAVGVIAVLGPSTIANALKPKEDLGPNTYGAPVTHTAEVGGVACTGYQMHVVQDGENAYDYAQAHIAGADDIFWDEIAAHIQVDRTSGTNVQGILDTNIAHVKQGDTLVAPEACAPTGGQ